jgi:flagellar FliL protein
VEGFVMTSATSAAPAGPDAPAKRSKLHLILGLALMALLGGGGFLAARSGLILPAAPEADHDAAASVPEVAFVALDPLIISVEGMGNRHLRFTAQLEVPIDKEAQVAMLRPRVLDVLNTYLRAVEPGDLTDRLALPRLQAQMLRRVRIVTGETWVNDLLITELVLN